MALIPCPDCGRIVSDLALACPDCARPIAGGTHAGADAAVGAGTVAEKPTETASTPPPARISTEPRWPDPPIIAGVLSRDLAGRPCPRCGKDLAFDYVMVSETSGEYRCLECVDRSGYRLERRRFWKTVATRCALAALALALAGGIVATIVSDPTTTSAAARKR